ncbi:hypothetical protein NJI34_34700 [Pseudomonas sp. S 311-6]|nr:hypothetical protein [Pseudomonas sp. S 311-6]
MTQNTEQIPARWYAVSRTGVATLCVDKNDARESAVQFDQDWPDAAPHVAVLLAPAGDGFVPVAASVLRTLAEPGLVKRTLGKFSPALAAQLGFTPEEEKAIEALYLAFGESFDFQCAAPAARGGTLADGTLCYLQDTRQYVGNCPMWWAKGGSGYTTRLDEAERYTLKDALRQHASRETDVPWPCAEIDPLARPTVDVQHMKDRANQARKMKAALKENGNV